MAGVTGEISRREAVDIAGMMVATGRAVGPRQWVDWLRDRVVAERESSMLDSLF